MKKLLSQIKRKINLKNKELQKRVLVFLVFTIIATFSWFLRALNDEYVADVRYPVEYINFPKDKLLTKAPPKKLVLRIQSDGYTILNSKFMPKRKLEFDVNSFSLNIPDGDSSVFYILTKYAKDILSNEFAKKNKSVNIIYIAPDTIYFNFSRLITRKLAVKPAISDPANIFKQQYTINGPITVQPDSIIITGPKELIDTMLYAYTVPLYLKELSDTLSRTCQLLKIDQIFYQQKKVKLTIPIDRFTESSFQVPLTIRNVPGSYKVKKIFPKSVSVNFLITLSNYNNIQADHFSPYLDFGNIDPELDSRVSVTLDSFPDIVRSLKVNPRSVEFLFEATETQVENTDNPTEN